MLERSVMRNHLQTNCDCAIALPFAQGLSGNVLVGHNDPITSESNRFHGCYWEGIIRRLSERFSTFKKTTFILEFIITERF